MMNSENMAQDLSPITFCDVVGSTNDEVRKLGQEGAERWHRSCGTCTDRGAWQTWTPVAFASGRAVSFGSFAPSGVNANAYGAPTRHVRLVP